MFCCLAQPCTHFLSTRQQVVSQIRADSAHPSDAVARMRPPGVLMNATAGQAPSAEPGKACSQGGRREGSSACAQSACSGHAALRCLLSRSDHPCTVLRAFLASSQPKCPAIPLLMHDSVHHRSRRLSRLAGLDTGSPSNSTPRHARARFCFKCVERHMPLAGWPLHQRGVSWSASPGDPNRVARLWLRHAGGLPRDRRWCAATSQIHECF